METIPPAGDFPGHSTRQSLVRFGGMYFRIRCRCLLAESILIFSIIIDKRLRILNFFADL